MRSMLAASRLAKSTAPPVTELTRTPSTRIRAWAPEPPRTRTVAILPGPPAWVTSAPGTVRSRSSTATGLRRSISSAAITVTALPTSDAGTS